MTATRRPARIVIVGGGTAGWIAACLFAHHWGPSGTRVTLIESPAIGIIGVGEGSTPQLKSFFDTLGIAEADWMPAANATWKGGIRFNRWSAHPGFDSYYHPFQTAHDHRTAPQFFHATRLRRAGLAVEAHPDRYFPLSAIAASGAAPVAGADGPDGFAYGYHFDAHLVGQVLATHARKLGVEHHQGTVADVRTEGEGEGAERRITSLLIEDGAVIDGDFFIDSTGFAALLAERTLGAAHISYADALFCDRAVVTPTPLGDGPVPAYTSATALSAGWVWHIPLTTRAGNGYVHSSRYIDADAAADELRAHLRLAPDAPVRHLSMRVGRLADSWVGNCLAVGLAQGFIEPLEATAIHLALATVEGFIAAVDGPAAPDAARAAFNADIGARYDGVRDYIVAHYRLNQRRDTPFWRDNAANDALSDPLRAILTAWFTADDLSAVLRAEGADRVYAPLSWHCLMAGYGVFPPAHRLRQPPADATLPDLADIDAFVADMAARFPDHRALIAARLPARSHA